jgi:protein TilB
VSPWRKTYLIGSSRVYRKLDLTLNFIDLEDLEESIENLSELPEMKELYMVGNPCTSWTGFLDYIAAMCPTIRKVDGDDISKSRRIEAKQKLPKLLEELRFLALDSIETKKNTPYNPEAYSKELRVEMYEDMVK